MDIQKRKTSVALLSVISNTGLVILKLVIGLTIGSVSVISEAIHSGVDLIAAGIALFAVKTSSKPADSDHPFGHGKIENISGAVEALLIFLAAGWIIYEAAKRIMRPEPLEAVAWGIGVMLLSAVANTVVSHMLFKVGKETDSVALQADGWHLRTDVYTSAGVMSALAVIYLGKRFFPGVDLHWVDPLAAILVALMIVRAAYHMTRQAARDLMDISLPREEQEDIERCIHKQQSRIVDYHGLRTRKAGADRYVEFHLLVDPKLSVEESHHITDVISDDIKRLFLEIDVTIHVEPCKEECTEECSRNCLL